MTDIHGYNQLGVLAYEQLAVSTTAVSMTSTTFQPTSGNVTGAKLAYVQNIAIGSGIVLWRVDGTAPTTTTGHELHPGQTLVLENYQEIRSFQAITRLNEPDAVLRITTYH